MHFIQEIMSGFPNVQVGLWNSNYCGIGWDANVRDGPLHRFFNDLDFATGQDYNARKVQCRVERFHDDQISIINKGFIEITILVKTASKLRMTSMVLT